MKFRQLLRFHLIPLLWAGFLAALPAGAAGLVAHAAQDPAEPAPLRQPLSADGSVGRVVDREGVAGRRPVLADRWRGVGENTRIEPGDWLKTGTRGANALHVRLNGGVELILGPGTLLEVAGASRLKLVRGEVEVAPGDGNGVEVAGAGDDTLTLRSRAVLRAADGRIEALEREPRWLAGYKGDASTEALGSLLANVDGRNVPLTIGYHKVTVDIRDQIARTVVEESFVNHTSSVLEGVFYFPLPADASISGFGMWIGNELVQGEIVEKQRAREIYETILREKRDPGLLEWAGGNLFKARVYPIGAEKRIRIAYTQVLPKQGDTYAYRYGLQSDMLRLTPLRRLQIAVNVYSADELADVRSTTHACRVRQTPHAASLEFDAEEHTPERDFELLVQTRASEAPLTVVPHRRGDDGYFMLLLEAPEADHGGGAPADLEPLDLIVLADTSGSMWGAPREAQMAFLEALLGALAEEDRVRLATCDVETRWAPTLAAGGTGTRAELLDFVEAREPLGWSDLESAFAAVADGAGPDTQVIYVGDGVPTSGDADPAALANRLERLYRGQGTFHAVVPGSSSEMLVLRALSRLGGGSVRSIAAGGDPADAAYELLEELTRPSWKELELQFEGVTVAAVYPERLPNLPLGRQQVVVGRFDPLSGATEGTATLRGTLRGEPFEFALPVSFDAEESGNSFVPRLWARRHLDHLLTQGSSPEVVERIVALSQDFQIITPYTSFLVLESDEDRERFQVEQRLRMRDGEEFFAEGRDAGRFELLRQQMLAAKSWRVRLQARALAALSDMGRELTELLRTRTPQPLPRSRAAGLGGAVPPMGQALRMSRQAETESLYLDGEADALNELGYADPDGGDWSEGQDLTMEERALDDLAFEPAREEMAAKRVAPTASGAPASPSAWPSGGRLDADYYGVVARGRNVLPQPSPDTFAGLFPNFEFSEPHAAPADWPEDVRELLQRLDRRPLVAAPDGGWRIDVLTETYDARERTREYRAEHLLSAREWLQTSAHELGQDYTVRWVRGDETGVAQAAWWLGRRQAVRDEHRRGWQAPFDWHFGDEVWKYRTWSAERVAIEDGRAKLRFWRPEQPEQGVELIVDVARGLVLEQRRTVAGKVVLSMTAANFSEAGGVWWPGLIRIYGEQGWPPSREVRLRVEPLEAEVFDAALEEWLAFRASAVLLGPEPESLASAKQAVRDDTATFEDQFLLLRHFAATQQWDRATPHAAAVLEQVGNDPGAVPLRAVWLQVSRRLEELKQWLLLAAEQLAAQPVDAGYARAVQLIRFAAPAQSGSERLALLGVLRPVFERQRGITDPLLEWDRQELWALQGLNRPRELLAKQQEMAEDYQDHAEFHVEYAHALAQRGWVDRALEWLIHADGEFGPWTEHEQRTFHRASAQILWNGYRLTALVGVFARWQERDPELFDAGLYTQWLSALIFLDRDEEAERLLAEWLVAYRQPELTPSEYARLQAAVGVALGSGHGFHARRLSDERCEQLAETAVALARHERTRGLAGQILTDWRFRQSEVGEGILADFYGRADAGVETAPVRELAVWIRWLRSAGFQPEAGEEGWQAMFARVYPRWLATEDPAERDILQSLLMGYGSPELQLDVLRRLYVEAEGVEARAESALALFQALMQRPWTEARQAELVGLLPELGREAGGEGGAAGAEADGGTVDLPTRILAVYDLAGWLPEARADAVLRARPDYNELSRRQLKAEHALALGEARAATAELLAEFEPSLGPAALKPWIAMERSYLLVKLRERLREVRTQSFEILSGLCERYVETPEEEIPLADRILAARSAATYSYLLARYSEEARREAEPPFRELLDRQIESGSELLDWRAVLYELLLALDRGDELEPVLRRWYGGGERMDRIRWGRDYGYVLAERGRLEEAVAVFEEIEGIDELTHDDYRALAGWSTALDRREAAREAEIRSWEVSGEPALAGWLSRERGKYQRQGDGVPPELDSEIPMRFVALLRKSSHPANQLWLLQAYYAATKDFRLLECLPEGVVGHSSQSIYAFLQNVQRVMDLIQEEATIDRLSAHLAEVRARVETPVDRRALFLLEFMARRQGAAQAQGAERHVEAALAALRAAFQEQWEEGEPRLMAELLASQGILSPEVLAVEQMRELRELMRLAGHRHDKLVIAAARAELLWGYNRREEAVTGLESALRELMEPEEFLPPDANDQLARLCSWLAELGRFRAAEEWWEGQLHDRAHSPDQRYWLQENLYRLYRSALLQGGEVSLGQGEELYGAYHLLITKALMTRRTNEGHAANLVEILCETWEQVHARLTSIDSVPQDAVRFAFEGLPLVLEDYQYRSGPRMVRDVARCLREVAGPRAALEFLVVRAENEPAWLDLTGQDFWSRHAHELARCRDELGRRLRDPLETRVLALVLAELRADLRSRVVRNRGMYSIRNSRFWSEKRDDFLETALTVLEERRDSSATLTHGAIYLFEDLHAWDDAIGVLAEARERGVLALDGKDRLADYLQRRGRWEESLPVVLELVAARPGTVGYRVMLMRARFHLGQPEALVRALEEAESWFREHDAWTEPNVAALAQGCLDTELFERCARLYGEAINLHTRSRGDRGVGDGALSGYYRQQSQAYAALGRTDDAVDAAAGAVIAWGRSQQQRASELENLCNVLAAADDLDAFVARLDASVAETGLENPILRKALGQVYLRQGEWLRAAAQLGLALEYQPNDLETHRALVSAYDRAKRPELAAARLLEWSRTRGHEPALYRELGRRYAELEEAATAERAWTSMVEAMPHESESHAALAAVREEQRRWKAAAEEWRQVVRIRTEEPAGYLGLARNLIRLERFEAASEVLGELIAGEWDARFGDVRGQARELLRELPSGS